MRRDTEHTYYKYKSDWSNATYSVRLVRSTYVTSGSLGIMAIEQDGAPFATLTVNIEPDSLFIDKDQAFVDTNNLPGVERFLVDNAIAKPAGQVAFSGYCSYPLYTFDMSKLEEVEQ